MSSPNLEDFFIKGSMWKLFRGANPYTFVETYKLLRRVFGYELFYVNYGYWKDGIETPEPGRELTHFIGDALGLKKGDRVLEAGSGLGQASIDSCTRYDLEKVVGLNICNEQADFANALTASQGLEHKIEHRICDACTEIDRFEHGEFDHAFAQECIGHFPDPLHYLTGVRKMLPSGGRMAITTPAIPPLGRWIDLGLGAQLHRERGFCTITNPGSDTRFRFSLTRSINPAGQSGDRRGLTAK